MKLRIATLILALMVAPLAQAEKYYKWQDADGTWHYGAKPPKDVQAEKLTVRAKAPSQSPEEAAEKARKDKARNGVPVASAEQCTKLRENLKVLDGEVSVRVNRNGEMQELSLEEQRAQAQRTRQDIEQFCD
jgi:hypothetical protein